MAHTLEPEEALPTDLVECLQSSQRALLFTGAGMSAESGIPTFRDAQSGLWSRFEPMRLASPEGFADDPGLVWRWYQWRRRLISQVSPNAAHHALARWQAACPGSLLITQNVDGLHQRAGSDPVVALHGNIHQTVCSETRQAIDQAWLDRHADREPPPSPHHPEGLARPDVVWFGEALDSRLLDRALQFAESADLVVVIGTAGLVQPAASIPVEAARRGTHLIEINPMPSELTRLATWRLAGRAAACVPKLQEVVRQST